MKHTFNKTILAVALAAVGSTSTLAGTFGSVQTANVEYAAVNKTILVGTAASAATTPIELITGATYFASDIIEVTFAGAAFDTKSSKWMGAFC
jgi:hypothetical protein